GQINDQRSQAHCGTGNLCRYLYLVHGGEEYGTHGEYNCSKAQSAACPEQPVAALSQRLMRNHQKGNHRKCAYQETYADMLCGGVMNFVGHETSDGASHHFQTILIDDAVHTNCGSRKHINLIQEGDKIS